MAADRTPAPLDRTRTRAPLDRTRAPLDRTPAPLDPTRAPVAFGRRAVPQLFEELLQPDAGSRLRALLSLCDLNHDPERIHQTATGGFLEQLKVLLKDEDSSVRTKTCELLHLLTSHSIGREALLASSLLPALALLLDSSSSCRRSVLGVLSRLALLPAGADALLTLVPKLMLKLREEHKEQEEELKDREEELKEREEELKEQEEEHKEEELNEQEEELKEREEELKEQEEEEHKEEEHKEEELKEQEEEELKEEEHKEEELKEQEEEEHKEEEHKEEELKEQEEEELKEQEEELKKQEEELKEEEEVLLLSTISSCSRLDALPALASDGVSLLGRKLSHRSPNIRREAAGALMALSVCEDGRRQVCEEMLLPVLVQLLQDEDLEVQANAAGVIMYTVIITAGKQCCLHLDVVPVLLDLVSREEEEEEEERKRRKALVMYSLRALAALAEAPSGRRLLLEQLPLLVRRSEAAEEDLDIRRAAQTAVRVVTWTP